LLHSQKDSIERIKISYRVMISSNIKPRPALLIYAMRSQDFVAERFRSNPTSVHESNSPKATRAKDFEISGHAIPPSVTGIFVSPSPQRAPFSVHDVEQVVVTPRSHLMHTATH
jgi:hypothetical protein